MPEESADILRARERNAFYESLSPEAKARFLRALERATAQNLDDEAIWREAVVAAETTYGPGGDVPPPERDEDQA